MALSSVLSAIKKLCGNVRSLFPIRTFSNVKLRLLNDKLGLKVLSMGMSNDYDVAIKCGSTYIRVGTKIFGKREYKKKINN